MKDLLRLSLFLALLSFSVEVSGGGASRPGASGADQ